MGGWTCTSDRNAKENITAIDDADVLAKLEAVPVARWRYIDDADKRDHIGPMAQDFTAAFGVGDAKTIATLDAQGVALAAARALHHENQKLVVRVGEAERVLAFREEQFRALESAAAEQRARLDRLEAALAKLTTAP